jgi:hypothetical protein
LPFSGEDNGFAVKWPGPDGTFSEPPAKPEDAAIVVYKGAPVAAAWKETADYYRIESGTCVLRVYKCWYFYGPSLKKILEGYTLVTGRPFFPPRWGLEFGDADCYNKKGKTPDVIAKVADVYRANDMPGGWILPNDGYGCGYTDLEYTVQELAKRGFYTGLWTEKGLDRIANEVRKIGTRVMKLDVAWVGSGYQFAMNGMRDAYEGIEKNSDARGFVLPVFVKAGAVIPMYPEMLHDREKPKDPVTFDIYPSGRSSFTLYEDDGVTQDYRAGMYARTLVEVDAPKIIDALPARADAGATGTAKSAAVPPAPAAKPAPAKKPATTDASGPQIAVKVGPAKGKYRDMPAARSYVVDIHLPVRPAGVKLNDKALPGLDKKEEFDKAAEGWFFDARDRRGVLHVKTKALPLVSGFTVKVAL